MIGGYYSSWGRKEEKEEEEKSYPLPRRRREKEGGEAAPTKRGEKEAERERERGGRESGVVPGGGRGMHPSISIPGWLLGL